MQHNALLYQLAITLADNPQTHMDQITRVARYLDAGGYTGMAKDLIDVAAMNSNEQTFKKSFFDEEMDNYNRPTTSKNSTFADYYLTRAREEGLA